MIAVVIFCLFFVSIESADSNVTISRCCGFNETLNTDTMECEEYINKWTNEVYTITTLNQSKILIKGYPDSWSFIENEFPICNHYKFIPLEQLIVVENNGYYLLSYNITVDKNFCFDEQVLVLCSEEYTNLFGNKTIVHRCCGKQAIFSSTQNTCLRSFTKKPIKGPKIEQEKDILFYDGFPCKNFTIEENFTGTIKNDGSIEWGNIKINVQEYCLEYLNELDELPGILVCRQHIIEVKPNDIRFIIYPIALSLSVIFLAATLIASFLMPASHHVLHWRCQTNYVLCLLLGKIVLCIIQFSGSSLADLQALCTILAFSMHFLFLSAFFWLNTMCFNIWWTFRDLRPQNLEKSQERCRLRLYVVYACGFPAVIAVIGLILDLVGDENTFYQPGFGKNNCWFQGNMEIMLYFFIPVGILLAVNLALFIATARELTCGLWKRELVKSTTERAALGRVCLKLVIVMGVFWIADIISWAVGGPHEYWYSTDIFNCLQGVFIFIVVGCQPQVLAAVKRYWCWRRGSAVETAGTTNHHSSTSQGQPSMGDTMCNHSVSNTTKSIALETSC
ncbi:probable G-protein coupled receptor Mth-like 1 isoform X2 [Onthophagus taurus]|uniref:probable G-protein coupled receptor Mth-like 1 isoform X2 n=1 Tax=Onthophagus taurus TaxID=166361 RepID=UPI0039BE5A6B